MRYEAVMQMGQDQRDIFSSPFRPDPFAIPDPFPIKVALSWLKAYPFGIDIRSSTGIFCAPAEI
jgi:hypothetical protein